MSTYAKKMAIYGALVLLTLWPLAHIVLVRQFDLSPWKLGGWGMYSAPRTGAGFQVLARSAAHEELQPIVVPDSAMAAAQEFHAKRRWLGELASPEPVADAVLAAVPDAAEVAILVERPVLSTTTGMIENTRKLYRFER